MTKWEELRVECREKYGLMPKTVPRCEICGVEVRQRLCKQCDERRRRMQNIFKSAVDEARNGNE